MKDKRTLIFEATLELISLGMKDSELTISAIAKKAGIGKGTVYEYFSSKAELLIEAVNYFVDIATRILSDVVSSGSFREQLKSFLKQVLTIINENEPLFNYLFLNQDFLKIEFERIGFSKDRDRKLIRLMLQIIAQGQSEKILREDITQRDVLLTFISITAVMNFTRKCNRLPEELTLSNEELFEYCINMFVKILC